MSTRPRRLAVPRFRLPEFHPSSKGLKLDLFVAWEHNAEAGRKRQD